MSEVLSGVDGLLSSVEAASTVEELRQVASRTVSNFGFDGFTYHVYTPGQDELASLGAWPAEWETRYEARHYAEIDPVVERLLRTMTPFSWHEALSGKPVNAPERVVMNEARCFGLSAGGEIPIHEPGYGGGTFSVFSNKERHFIESWTRHKNDLHIFCIYFHEKYRKIVPPAGSGFGAFQPLTSRERECLLQTARGKTAAEVGEILNISERTAKEHLTNATRKFGTFSKHHAVVKAILNRIIMP